MQRYVKRHGSAQKSTETGRLRGFRSPHLSVRFQDDFWGWDADRIPELFIGEVILPEQVDVLPRDDGVVGDSGLAEAMLKDTVNYPFVGDVIDQLRIGRTAFYRYFPPDRIRELRNQP